MFTRKAPLGVAALLSTGVLGLAAALPGAAATIDVRAEVTPGFVTSTVDYGTYTATTGTAFQDTGPQTIFGGPTSGLAKARADLATGELGVFTETTGYGGAFAFARYTEDLTFHTGGGADAITPITLLVQWHGDVRDGSSTDYNFSLFQNSFNATLQFDARGRSTGVDYTIQQVGQWASYGAPAGAGTPTQTFTFTYNLKGSDPVITLATSMRAWSQFTTSANVYHTAAVNFVLPENVTFTSSSGTYLSKARTISAAPEPASWALMIGGFGLAGGALRRRRPAAS